MTDGYHHGDLPRQLLAHAARLAAESGPETVTLRELARRTNVSHSAPVHHFGTRRGLLTALAADGFRGLGDALSDHRTDLYDMGVAYISWALEHPGHYAVMWQPRLLDESDATLRAARDQAWALLSSTVAVDPESANGERTRVAAYAAFALVHGLSSLWLSEALPRPDDPAALAREITARLQPS